MPEPATAPAPAPAKSKRRSNIETALVIVGAVVIAVTVRSFLIQTFWIPSASMSPTLVEGDRVIVNKLTYRLHDPSRGDVVVFHRSPNMPTSGPDVLIKRIVAEGGDTVSILDGHVTVNGHQIDEPYTHGLPTTAEVGCPITAPTEGIGTAAGFEIPEGDVLVLGDNRTDSQDGRCFGPIDTDQIIGRASRIAWPPSHAGGL